MTNAVSFHRLRSCDMELIDKIAQWYFIEWKVPIDLTLQRLKMHPNEDVLFQWVLKLDGQPVGTGGLYNEVKILSEYPRFRTFGPWVALLYTARSCRNQGLGGKLLEKIEEAAQEMGFKKIYLYTFTAERLYLRMNWKPVERVDFKGQDAVVMVKEL